MYSVSTLSVVPKCFNFTITAKFVQINQHLPSENVLSTSPSAEEVVSVDDDSPESVLVLEEITDPGSSPGLVLGIVGADDAVSLSFQFTDDSRNVSDSGI